MGLRIRVVWIGPLASSGCGLVICRVRVCGLELPGWAAHAAAENLVISVATVLAGAGRVNSILLVQWAKSSRGICGRAGPKKSSTEVMKSALSQRDPHDAKSAAKSATLARRISTGRPQEMQKNSRQSSSRQRPRLGR